MKTPSLRGPAIGSAVILAALAAAATPALAAPIGDGTSNTIQVAVASPHSGYVFSDIMIESLTGTTTSLSLNYAKLEFQY